MNRDQQSYKGKHGGLKDGTTGKTKLRELTGWDSKPTKGYPQADFRFPDPIPLVLARAIAVCLQAGLYPFDYIAMAQLVI